ncbi:hypothetical protein [Halobacillus shinanisalinarum]|uniref:hypothetical protein n=1 Tax=Halobacillus shinanisalinarum TaxID=2932258 RepID=UPI0037BEB1DB
MSHIVSLNMYNHASPIPRASIQTRERDRCLAEGLEEYRLIQSIPGIGGKIAARFISEVGKSISLITQRTLLPIRELSNLDQNIVIHE